MRNLKVSGNSWNSGKRKVGCSLQRTKVEFIKALQELPVPDDMQIIFSGVDSGGYDSAMQSDFELLMQNGVIWVLGAGKEYEW